MTLTAEQDPFAYFGLPATIRLDRAALDRAYTQKMRAIHPDVVAQDQKAEAEIEAASCHRAYQQLSGFRSRAEVILRLRGEFSAGKQVPPGFLEEIFSINERLEEGEDLLAEAETRVIARRRSIESLLEQNAPLSEVRALLNAYIYEENLYKQCESKEED
ncbi:MAG: hypothetical protein H6510_00075 [Acidobacteria bacterium]|nr:hypothetical protein [Acidobacteriota bacterium]MCB9396183.1 hypothetical protein [Acidobacteriota bacterium]